MLNYLNIDDYEFELLCQDIMEKKLGVSLRSFGRGKDGGIDLCDDVLKPRIIVQVKYYMRSSFSNLKRSLSKEVERIEQLAPEQYYICCLKELTRGNVTDIYNMFASYMDSAKNIVTQLEIDRFLTDPQNIEIARKHCKLWFSATGILSEINNQDIFIDCASLLADAEEDNRRFVQTPLFDKSVEVLEKTRSLMLIGDPGVGKTITSKMLVLFFAKQGYRVRYTTAGNVRDVKNSLLIDSDIKEMIFIDDCLGQCYLHISETQENEILSLLKYVKMTPNKIILLNSRVTVLNAAKERSQEFLRYIESEKIKLYIIDLNDMGNVYKARIFYNHLILNHVPNEYYSSVRTHKNYRRIIAHRNYNPRIIEYVSSMDRYNSVCPNKYYDYIVDRLDNPEDVWREEFERRLGSVDRILMAVLYSLTDDSIELEILKECFTACLLQVPDIDFTINHFEAALARLNGSLVKVVQPSTNEQLIQVLNPSINDYLRIVFNKNEPFWEYVKRSAVYFEQLERLYGDKIDEVILEKIINGSILNIKDRIRHIDEIVLYGVCKFKILDQRYTELIIPILLEISSGVFVSKDWYEKDKILFSLLCDPLFSFYKIDQQILSNKSIIERMLGDLEMESLVEVVNQLHERFCEKRRSFQITQKQFQELLEVVCDSIFIAIKQYAYAYFISDFVQDTDIDSIIDEITKNTKRPCELDEIAGSAIDRIHDMVEERAKEEIGAALENINDIYSNYISDWIDNVSVPYDEIENAVNSYLQPDREDFDIDRYFDGNSDWNQVDRILDKELPC